MTERRSAVRSVLLYALAIGTVSGASFIAVPLLLTLLGHEEFGRWALLEPILLIALPAAGLGIQIGLLRVVKRGTNDSIVVAAVLPFHLGAAAIVGLIAAGVALSIGAPWPTSMLLGAIVALEGSIIFFVSLWRAQDKPGLFATVEGGRAVLIAAALGVALVIVGGSALVTTEYLALRLGIGLMSVVLSFMLVRPMLRPNFGEARRAVQYGAPIVVAAMLAAVLITVDRFALAHTGSDQLAGYVAHARVAQLLAVAVAAFYTWYAPIAIRRLDEGRGAHSFFIDSTTAFVFALIVICANVWLVTPFLWPLIFPTVLLDKQLFAILLVGTAVFAMGNPLSLGTLRPGKTHHAGIITAAAVGVVTAASFTFAEPFGPAGVAAGRGLGLAAYTLLFTVHTVVFLGIRYPWLRWGGLATAAALGCLLFEHMLVGIDLLSLAGRLILVNLSLAVLGFLALRSSSGARTGFAA